MKNKTFLKNGFSLLEVLVFITILGIFFLTAISVSIFTLRDMRVSQERIFASKYAEEMSEWLKAERDTDWNTFYSNVNKIVQSGGCTIQNCGCKEFNSFDIDWNTATSCSGSPSKPPDLGMYNRVVTFPAPQSQSKINVTITVQWNDGKQQYSVPINTVYTE